MKSVLLANKKRTLTSTVMAVSPLRLPVMLAAPVALAMGATYLALLFRFGLLAMAAAQFTGLLFGNVVTTLNPARWYFWGSALALVILAAMVIHGFRAALAGRPVFGRALAEEW